MRKIILVLLVGMVLAFLNACTASLGFFDGEWEITLKGENVINGTAKKIMNVEKNTITKLDEYRITNQKVDDDGSFFVKFAYIDNGKEYTTSYKGKLDVYNETKGTLYGDGDVEITSGVTVTIRKKK